MPPHGIPTPDAIARVRERYDAGDPTAELARVLGISEPTFRKWRKAWGWPMRHASSARVIAPKRTRRPSAAPVATQAAQTDGVETEANRAADDLAADIDINAAVAVLDDDATAPSTERIAAALRRALYAEVAVLLAGSGSKRGSEARARALASIGRTIAMLGGANDRGSTATGPESDDTADAPTVDVAELRHELARRLHFISQEREDA